MRYIIPFFAFILAASLTYLTVDNTKDRVEAYLGEAPASQKTVLRDIAQSSSAPTFRLTNQRGEEITDHGFENHITIVSFFFSSCEGPCPALNARLVKLGKELSHIPSLQFFAISIDPKVDSPKVLKDYAEKIGATGPNWNLLTGPDEATIGRLSRDGFKLGLDDMALVHSTSLVLVDSKKRIRGYFQGPEEESVVQLKQAVPELLDEKI